MMGTAAQEEGGQSMDFASLCTYLEKLESHSRSTGLRASSLQLLHRLLDAARNHGDLYAVVRILIPKRDVERQHYNLKENSLAVLLIQALGIGADSKDGMLLSNWKRAESFAAGDFTGLAMQVISRRQSAIVARLSVANINSVLDKLAKSSRRKARVELIKDLLRKSTAVEFKWVLRIVLKDLKIGLGENTVLDVLHEDARAMMATCVDLKRVCSELHDRTFHPFRRELTLGKVLKCQHSKRTNSVEAAWLAMKHCEVVAECKFDGDRMQIHKDGPKIWFWSRNGKEHPEYMVPLQEALCCCLSSQRCVLDGELLVWDVEDSGFKARTKTLNHDAARAARKGTNTSHRVCYVIFDILYEEKFGSVMHLPLKQRRKILRQVVYPDRSPQIFCTATEGSEWAIVPNTLEKLKEFFWHMVEKGNEGIVVKRLDSEWVPDNRDGRWSKIKPDYVFVGSDLDLLIIGGYYGSGSRGGKIASFLLALIDHCGSSTRFVSICRCGQGLSEDEFSVLERKLSPYIIQNQKGGRPPPTCGYLVTNSRYECPDVWISRPEMSIVLQISSEKRIYPSQSFKAGWTFRFPRIIKIRYDKSWKEALGVQEFEDMVKAAKNHGNSLLHGSHGYNQLCGPRQSRKCLQAKRYQAVLPHLQNLDVSHIEKVDSFFEDLIFYICSGNIEGKEELQIQIKRSGGKTVPNFVPCVTHIVASEAKGFHFQVAVENNRDVISLTWVSDCMDAKALLPFSPRHYLFQSPTTRRKMHMVIDMYGDPWFGDVDTQDVKKMFSGINDKEMPFTEQSLRLQWKRRKIDKNWHWNLFQGCHFYFHKPLHSVNPDSQILANVTLNRLRLAAEMFGASISQAVMLNTTHVIVYVPSISMIPLKRLLQSLKQSEKVILQSPDINIVGHSWLEECMNKKERLCIKPYLLRKGLDVSTESKCVKRQCTNSIDSQRCRSRDVNLHSSISRQSSKVVGIDVDHYSVSSQCKTADNTHEERDEQSRRALEEHSDNTHEERDEQSRPAVEEHSKSDDSRKRQLKGISRTPKCSLWGASLKVESPKSFECVNAKENQNKGSTPCIQESNDLSIILQDKSNVCNTPWGGEPRLQCDPQLSMSKMIWESQCLQDIAQVYLGSYG